ncbi:hypothetical protein [Metasolibacillus meyeri]|uniref:hypothetical protein n=1 Tax=Metasolibacillus meyeri TaxID=1071052 RepID=UPI000D3227AD|nr:hypothetical protein [Metasolibacillus meyeri]
MKKIAIVLLSISLLFGGFSTAPVQAETLNKTSLEVNTMSITRSYTYEKFYHKTESVPTILYYQDQYGWYGNLQLQNVVPYIWDPMYVVALYKGTLTCPTGTCPSPTSLKIEEQ